MFVLRTTFFPFSVSIRPISTQAVTRESGSVQRLLIERQRARPHTHPALLGLYADVFDYLRPERDLFLHEGGKILQRVAGDLLSAHPFVLRADPRVVNHLLYDGKQLVDDRLRCTSTTRVRPTKSRNARTGKLGNMLGLIPMELTLPSKNV